MQGLNYLLYINFQSPDNSFPLNMFFPTFAVSGLTNHMKEIITVLYDNNFSYLKTRCLMFWAFLKKKKKNKKY